MMNFLQLDNARLLPFGKIITKIMRDQNIDLSAFPSKPPEEAFQKKNLGLMKYKLYSFPITIDTVPLPPPPSVPRYQPHIPSSSVQPSQDIPQSSHHAQPSIPESSDRSTPGPSSPHPSHHPGPQYLFPPPAVLSLQPSDYGVPEELAGLFRHQTDLAIAIMNSHIIAVNQICRSHYPLLPTSSGPVASDHDAVIPSDSDEHVEVVYSEAPDDTAETHFHGPDHHTSDAPSDLAPEDPALHTDRTPAISPDVVPPSEDGDRVSTPPETTIHSVLKDIAGAHSSEVPPEDIELSTQTVPLETSAVDSPGDITIPESTEFQTSETSSVPALTSDPEISSELPPSPSDPSLIEQTIPETHPSVSSDMVSVSPLRKKRKVLVSKGPSFRTEPSIHAALSRSSHSSQFLDPSVLDPSARPAPHFASMGVAPQPLAFTLPGSNVALHPALFPFPIIDSPPSSPELDA